MFDIKTSYVPHGEGLGGYGRIEDVGEHAHRTAWLRRVLQPAGHQLPESREPLQLAVDVDDVLTAGLAREPDVGVVRPALDGQREAVAFVAAEANQERRSPLLVQPAGRLVGCDRAMKPPAYMYDEEEHSTSGLLNSLPLCTCGFELESKCM